MEISLAPGAYLLAVSGGVDSVVLLDVLAAKPDVRLTVAHFDHGIRPESASDAQFVAGLAKHYGLPFVTERAELGPQASEAAARQARYEFLHRVATGPIITAHHLDDRLETAIFNIIRGTGRRGLSSLRSTDLVKRPLLGMAKAEILSYAQAHNLQWREDRTNQDLGYRRNYIRQRLLPAFPAADRQSLLTILDNMMPVNSEIDQLVATIYQNISTEKRLQRRPFIRLPHAVAKEILYVWLQERAIDINTSMLERLVQACKTKPPGKRITVGKNSVLEISRDYLALRTLER